MASHYDSVSKPGLDFDFLLLLIILHSSEKNEKQPTKQTKEQFNLIIVCLFV